MIFEFNGKIYPEVLRKGNAARFIVPMAEHFCKGRGLDVGCGKYPLKGAIPIDKRRGSDAMSLPSGEYDYVFSSHCLEHLPQPIEALKHWKSRLRKEGVLFLYLPHPDMEIWWPENNPSHLQLWSPLEMYQIVKGLGFHDVMHSERDAAYGFTVIGFA